MNAVVHNYFQVFAYHSPERKRSCRFCLPTWSSFRTMVRLSERTRLIVDLGVIYLTPESEASSELAVQWNQGSIAKNSNYGPISKLPAAWEPAVYDFKSGLVTLGRTKNLSETEISCQFFVLGGSPEEHRL